MKAVDIWRTGNTNYSFGLNGRSQKRFPLKSEFLGEKSKFYESGHAIPARSVQKIRAHVRSHLDGVLTRGVHHRCGWFGGELGPKPGYGLVALGELISCFKS